MFNGKDQTSNNLPWEKFQPIHHLLQHYIYSLLSAVYNEFAQ